MTPLLAVAASRLILPAWLALAGLGAWKLIVGGLRAGDLRRFDGRRR